jgi:hypothetical protein
MATTTIGNVTNDQGHQTKKATRASIRSALEGIGLTCGLLSREGKAYSALITDSDITVTAAREAGSPIEVACGKRKLTALTKAAAKGAAKAQAERDEKTAAKAEAKAAKAASKSEVKSESKSKGKGESRIKIGKAVPRLEDFVLESMDEQGRLTSAHPRDGGMSAGLIRAMLADAGYDVPPKMRKSDMVDMLLAIVSAEGPVAAAVEAPEKAGKVIQWTSSDFSAESDADLDVKF